MTRISAQTRSRMLRAVKSKNTSLELRFRKALFAAGVRYRLHCKDLPGSPDLVFYGRKKVIFIHGCFWHQHKHCKLAKTPITNTGYWMPKLERNYQRDQENALRLASLGWQVHTVWECSLNRFQLAVNEAIGFLNKANDLQTTAMPGPTI